MQLYREQAGCPARRRAPTGAASGVCLESIESRTLFAATGLTGSYFSGDFGSPSVQKVDPTINFDWRQNNVGQVGFSSRWTGQVRAKYSESYRFYTRSNGGVKLWINDRLLISDDNSSGADMEQQAMVRLQAGQWYNVRLEFVGDAAGADKLKLLWSSTRTAKQVIPTDRLVPVSRSTYKLRVSFRDTSVAPPQYYKPDNGGVFSSHGLGYYYGWDVDNSDGTFDRNSTLSYSERYDGGALMQTNGQNRTWRVQVPNGQYHVRVVAGDPAWSEVGTYYSIDVDGVRAVRGAPSAYTHWYDGTVTINVTDGQITLTNGAGAANNRINFVEITPASDSDRLVSWRTIAGSTADPSTRGVSQGFLGGSWANFVNSQIQPEIALGGRRFVLHNPFGTDRQNGAMVLDQYLDAQRDGLNWLTDGFVQAFKPITASGVEVIAYIGQPDADFGTTTDSWNQRFWASIKPLLDAKMSIAFDGAVAYSESSPLYAAAQKLQSMDVKVYVEARPEADKPWWFNFRVISIEDWWHFSNPQENPDSWWGARNDQLTGEVLRWINHPIGDGSTWTSSGWMAPAALDILDDGNTPAISVAKLGAENVELDSLISRLNGYRGGTLLSGDQAI